MVIRCFVCLLGFVASVALAQHQHKANAVPLAASAAFDARGGLWAVAVEGPHVVLRRSMDVGNSWSAARRVNAAAEPIGAEGDARPKIALGAGGEVYVTWTRPLGKPYTGEIRFARSLDAGRSFGMPLTVHGDRQEITHRFDALTVARDGKLFIAWIDKRDPVKAGKAYRGAAVYFAVSDNRGASFRGDYKLADHSCECCRIALLPRGDGSVLALWRHVFEPNVRDHALALMHADGCATGLRRATFDDWAVDVCPQHGPSPRRMARDACMRCGLRRVRNARAFFMAACVRRARPASTRCAVSVARPRHMPILPQAATAWWWCGRNSMARVRGCAR